jgi:hypothetical protein
MPTLVAGPADRFSEQQLQHMAKIAADRLADLLDPLGLFS